MSFWHSLMWPKGFSCADYFKNVLFCKNCTWWPLMTLTPPNNFQFTKYILQLQIPEILRYHIIFLCSRWICLSCRTWLWKHCYTVGQASWTCLHCPINFFLNFSPQVDHLAYSFPCAHTHLNLKLTDPVFTQQYYDALKICIVIHVIVLIISVLRYCLVQMIPLSCNHGFLHLVNFGIFAHILCICWLTCFYFSSTSVLCGDIFVCILFSIFIAMLNINVMNVYIWSLLAYFYHQLVLKSLSL